jgi:hypothetical protein
MCFDFLYKFVWNISHSKKSIKRNVIKNVIALRVRYPLFLSDFNETWVFSTDFRKNTHI